MNVTTAVDTIIAAGNAKIILVNVADPGLVPEVLQQFPEAYKRQRVTDAINLLNSRLQTMAEARDIPVIDLANVSLDILSLADNDGYLLLDGEKINILETGDEPHHLRLGDSSGHAGTVAAGLMANELFIKPLREIYGVAIEPLSALEILQNANLR